MKLSELISEPSIRLDIRATEKREVIRGLVGTLVDAARHSARASGTDAAPDAERVIGAVWDREELMSTGIGLGIGIPHAKTNAVDHLSIVFGRSVAGVDFAALDGKPVHIFFLLVATEDQSGPHVKALARISRLLKHHYFRQALLEAKTPRDLLAIIREEEMKHA